MYVNNLVSENPAVNKMIEPEKLLPKRVDDSHKGTYGRALLIAGSKGMAGAACLAGLAAYRAGCGLVEIVTHESNRIIVQTFLPEAVVVTYDEETDIEALIKREADRADSLGIGPGIGLDDTADKLTASVCRYVGENDIPAVFDADALTILGGSASSERNVCVDRQYDRTGQQPAHRDCAVICMPVRNQLSAERSQNDRRVS